MILDARTIAQLFLAGLAAILVLLLSWIALRARFGRRPSSELESLGSLLALVMGALLFLRLLAWANFFLLLDGYVPSLTPNGVMCAFGVVQLRPELAHFALWAKPIAIGCLLCWWALSMAERDVSSAPFEKLRFALVLPLAVLVGAEIFSEARWLFADKLNLPVTCCSAALDATRTPDWFVHTGIFGLSTAQLGSLLVASKIALIAACALIARKKPQPRLLWTLSLCATSVGIAILDLHAWREVIAPRALGLEFHRCAYELVTRSLALGPAALFAALAHLGLFALPLLASVRSHEPRAVQHTVASIAGACALGLASELIALAIHVF